METLIVHFLVELKGILSLLSKMVQHLHFCISTHFLSKFMFFLITQKVTFFTHPDDFLGNNSNNPMGTTGFHAFFENS